MSETSPVEATMISRRGFLKRAFFGVAALTVASIVASGSSSIKGSSSKLGDNSSIFSPRRQDLMRHWRNKLSGFRLK